MVPLTILGLLLRGGPQHGYRIRKAVEEGLADFTQIKLPTIYYHLERMEAEGLLNAAHEKPGSRPEKTVYTVTKKGEQAFQALLAQALDFSYRPVFHGDLALYFADCLQPGQLEKSLSEHAARLECAREALRAHRAQAMLQLPCHAQTTAGILFDHHDAHLRAELDWAQGALSALKKEDSYA